jgi:hypothetical protein
VSGARGDAAALAAALGLACGLAAVAFRTGEALEGASARVEDGAELRFFPTGPWVRPLACGHARLAADLAWLEAIQYYGLHRKTDRRYPYAETLFRTLTGLDPSFEAAYVFGALVLAEDGGRPEAARALLRQGMSANPGSWLLPFEYGFLAYLGRWDRGEAPEYLARASRMPGAPSSVARLAAHAATRAQNRNLAIELWREMLRSSENEEVRRIALRSLRELGAAEAGAGG